MYPYETTARWWIRGRHKHLMDAVQGHDCMDDDVLANRIKRMGRWLTGRIVVLLLLYFALISRLIIGVLNAAAGDDAAAAVDTLDTVARLTSTLSGVFGVAVLFIQRTLGQLEMDVLLRLGLDVQT